MMAPMRGQPRRHSDNGEHGSGWTTLVGSHESPQTEHRGGYRRHRDHAVQDGDKPSHSFNAPAASTARHRALQALAQSSRPSHVRSSRRSIV